MARIWRWPLTRRAQAVFVDAFDFPVPTSFPVMRVSPYRTVAWSAHAEELTAAIRDVFGSVPLGGVDRPWADEVSREIAAAVLEWLDSQGCHCGRPVTYGYDGDPTHHRGMCGDCDAVRCDAYPDECPYR